MIRPRNKHVNPIAVREPTTTSNGILTVDMEESRKTKESWNRPLKAIRPLNEGGTSCGTSSPGTENRPSTFLLEPGTIRIHI